MELELTFDSRITPAYAGHTCVSRRRAAGKWDHPRLRGAYIACLKRSVCRQGSPPLTRGIPFDQVSIMEQYRITPAYAGHTRSRRASSPRSRDHPRLRGAYERQETKRKRRRGSPPLTRGIRSYDSETGTASRITPAYAGHTEVENAKRHHEQDHPRLRGAYF